MTNSTSTTVGPVTTTTATHDNGWSMSEIRCGGVSTTIGTDGDRSYVRSWVHRIGSVRVEESAVCGIPLVTITLVNESGVEVRIHLESIDLPALSSAINIAEPEWQ